MAELDFEETSLYHLAEAGFINDATEIRCHIGAASSGDWIHLNRYCEWLAGSDETTKTLKQLLRVAEEQVWCACCNTDATLYPYGLTATQRHVMSWLLAGADLDESPWSKASIRWLLVTAPDLTEIDHDGLRTHAQRVYADLLARSAVDDSSYWHERTTTACDAFDQVERGDLRGIRDTDPLAVVLRERLLPLAEDTDRAGPSFTADAFRQLFTPDVWVCYEKEALRTNFWEHPTQWPKSKRSRFRAMTLLLADRIDPETPTVLKVPAVMALTSTDASVITVDEHVDVEAARQACLLADHRLDVAATYRALVAADA